MHVPLEGSRATAPAAYPEPLCKERAQLLEARRDEVLEQGGERAEDAEPPAPVLPEELAARRHCKARRGAAPRDARAVESAFFNTVLAAGVHREVLRVPWRVRRHINLQEVRMVGLGNAGDPAPAWA